jgi:methionine-rich copper-binding protein CopC
MKGTTRFLLLAISVLAPTLLFAHAKLTEARPADGAVVNASPETLTLTFSEEVQLLKVALTGNDNKELATDFAASAAKQTSFAVTLPELAQDSYTVNWTILGNDGHKVEGSYAFSVETDAAEKEGDTAEKTHTEHGH